MWEYAKPILELAKYQVCPIVTQRRNHAHDYLRDANSDLYQHNIERIYDKYDVEQPTDVTTDVEPNQEPPQEQIMVA